MGHTFDELAGFFVDVASFALDGHHDLDALDVVRLSVFFLKVLPDLQQGHTL